MNQNKKDRTEELLQAAKRNAEKDYKKTQDESSKMLLLQIDAALKVLSTVEDKTDGKTGD